MSTINRITLASSARLQGLIKYKRGRAAALTGFNVIQGDIQCEQREERSIKNMQQTPQVHCHQIKKSSD